MNLPTAHQVRPLTADDPVGDHVLLTHDERLIRRRRLVTRADRAFLADLPALVAVEPGLGFVLTDGTLIGVIAAPEPLLEVRGDLPRLAWHIGNRHAPCQIFADRILVRAGRVMAGMLQGLGASVIPVSAPFFPEGGAYGAGRTMGHDHLGESGPADAG